jgi:hypothetical protein
MVRCSAERGLTIQVVGGLGQLEFASIENEPIEGHYDAATNAISFDDNINPRGIQTRRGSWYAIWEGPIIG